MTDPHSLPSRIGRYDIKSLLGAGAMGSVYLAEDPRIKRKLAIKVVKMDNLRSDQDRRELLARFEREAEISGILNDPGIVTIYDLGDSDCGPFLAMEFVQGSPLDAFIKGGGAAQAPIPARIRILAGIASALDHAHAHGIIHRDVKPANVMLTESGRPKLMDFGIAKREDAGLTQTGTFLGTPSYASPEQIKDGHSTPKSDIFSLGVLAFELLSGSLPFQGNSINTILYRIVNEPPVEIHPPVLGLVPDAWRRIFMKVLAKSPDERYATCSAFIRELLDAAVDLTEAERVEIAGLLPQVGSPTPLETLTIRPGASPLDPKTTRVSTAHRPRRRWPWVAGGLLVTGMVAGGLWFLPKGSRVMVTSQPRGAKLIKDGVVIGETPLPVSLSAGESVTLEAPGYMAETRRVERGEKEVAVVLKGRSSEVTLSSDPPGASVVLDDRPLAAVTPVKVSWTHWEPHRLTLTLRTPSGDLVHAQDFKPGEAPDGQPFRLQGQGVNAPPNAPGGIRFTATYPVRVKMEGRDLGEVRPGALIPLPAGEHRLEVSNPKLFLQRSLTVQVSPGVNRSLPLPEVVQLVVSTHPSSGFVLVNGQPTGIESDGNTPIALVKGTHTIAIQGSPGSARQVDVEASKTLKFKY